MDISYFAGVIAVTGLLIVMASSLVMIIFNRNRRLPPGPTGLPLLGSLPFWKGPETNLEWYKTYGDIYSVRMGSNLLVYLNTVSLVDRYMANSQIYVDRPPGPGAIAQGLLFGSGCKWRLNRKICTRRLWNETAHQTFEQQFRDEAVDMMTTLERHVGKEFNLTDVFRLCVANGLSSLIRGKRYQYTDPEYAALISFLRELDNADFTSLSTAISLKMHWLWALFPHNSRSLKEITTSVADVIRKWIAERREDPKEAKQSEDIIDLFLNDTEYHQENETDDEMIQTTSDTLNSGLLTTLSGLEFVFLYLLHNPDVQRKAQKEIDDVIGRDRQPTWADRSRLPYTAATILESLRLGCVSPSTLPHVAIEDSTIEGYHVPKGAQLMASVFCLHRQPDVFEDPESFKPERHVNDDGTLKKFANFMPFGVEPRLCVGDDWFHVFAFLIVTSVLQRYNVDVPAGKQLPPFNSRMRIVRRLVPYTVVLTSRSAT